MAPTEEVLLMTVYVQPPGDRVGYIQARVIDIAHGGRTVRRCAHCHQDEPSAWSCGIRIFRRYVGRRRRQGHAVVRTGCGTHVRIE